jgi:acyl carrier protein
LNAALDKYIQMQSNICGQEMTTKLKIESEIQKVASEQNVTLAPLSDDLNLLDSGLDSLCFAILVARLEDSLGVDPFTASDDVSFPVTLGDFVQAYENAAR